MTARGNQYTNTKGSLMLSREEAQEHGLAFAIEDERPPFSFDVAALRGARAASRERTVPAAVYPRDPLPIPEPASPLALADLVRSGQEAGEFSPDIDPKDFAVRYGAMMDGLAIKVVAGIDGMDVARLLEACSATAVRELGLRVPRRPRKRTRAVP